MVGSKKISWKQIEICCRNIVNKILKDGFKPSVVIGISRGGAIVGTIISHLLNCDLAIVSASRYNNSGCYSSNQQIAFHRKFSISDRILVVDDIFDKGITITKTLEWLKRKLPNNEFRIGCLYRREFDKTTFDYYSEIVKEPMWLKFPWEV